MKNIEQLKLELTQHPIYQNLNCIENIRTFMEYHVFAVFDFMSLLKSLQRKVTCVDLPWKPSGYQGEMVRLINEIVLGEESDELPDHQGYLSHFELYLNAMKEIGANTKPIEAFLKNFDMTNLNSGIKDFISFNLDLALNGELVEVASSFFWGREKIIPDMFEKITSVLETEKIHAPLFIYYLKRHIEVDAHDHGPKAMRFLELICGDSVSLWEKTNSIGELSLRKRYEFWNQALFQMENKNLILNQLS